MANEDEIIKTLEQNVPEFLAFATEYSVAALSFLMYLP